MAWDICPGGWLPRALVASGTREGGVFPEQGHLQPWEGVNFQSAFLSLSLYGDFTRVSSVPIHCPDGSPQSALLPTWVLPLPAHNL